MADTGRMPLVRVLTNRFMSYLLSRISGQRIPDTQCGFRLIKISALKKITLEVSNFDIDSEIILKAARAGCAIRVLILWNRRIVRTRSTSSLR